MREVILTSIISVASIFASYVIGRAQATRSQKLEAARRVYESWHIPLITLLYESSIWTEGFSRLPEEYRKKFYNLVVESLQFMDTKTLEFVDGFLDSYQFVYGSRAKLPDARPVVPLTPARLEELFDELICSALKHSLQQARRLKQPEIGKYVLELYLDSQGFRQKLKRAISELDGTNEQ